MERAPEKHAIERQLLAPLRVAQEKIHIEVKPVQAVEEQPEVVAPSRGLLWKDQRTLTCAGRDGENRTPPSRC